MKKVYVLIDEGCYDCESSTDVRVYADYEKAKQDFEDSRAQLIADWIDDGSWVIEDDDEDYFQHRRRWLLCPCPRIPNGC